MNENILLSRAEQTLPRLSPAEQALLPALLRGDTEKGIAIRLRKGRRTVNKQVASIYKAYGVNSRMELLNRHHELLARQNLAQNGPDGVNTPLQGFPPPPHTPSVAQPIGRRNRESAPSPSESRPG